MLYICDLYCSSYFYILWPHVCISPHLSKNVSRNRMRVESQEECESPCLVDAWQVTFEVLDTSQQFISVNWSVGTKHTLPYLDMKRRTWSFILELKNKSNWTWCSVCPLIGLFRKRMDICSPSGVGTELRSRTVWLRTAFRDRHEMKWSGRSGVLAYLVSRGGANFFWRKLF